MPEPQNFKNHTRLHAPYHFVLVPLALAGIIAAAFRLFRHPGVWNGWELVMAIAMFVAVALIRVYPLKVQDRVIRLEETLRMQRLLPAEVLSRIDELSVPQVVALRFASDQELAGLVEKTLTHGWAPKIIKQNVRDWRADHWRV